MIKEEKRVSNVLYGQCNKCLESNVTSCLTHVTKQRCWRLDFSQDCEEQRRFSWILFMNARFISRSARVFSSYRARVSKRSRPHPLLAIWIECSDWPIFEFLARDFPKTSRTGHIAHSILSSLPLLSTLATIYQYTRSQLRERGRLLKPCLWKGG